MKERNRQFREAAFLPVLTVISALTAGSLTVCMGQGSPALAFDAATIKVTDPDRVGGAQWSIPGGSIFTATNVSLEFLTAMAYNVDVSQVQAAPSFFGSKHFDLSARAESGVALSREALRPRLQTLLRERFHLEIHRTTVYRKGFALLVAPRGLKLTPASSDQMPNFRVDVSNGNMRGKNWSMDFCAQMLTPKLGGVVVDRTGLTGRYDIDLQYAPQDSDDTTLPSLTTVLESQAGLRIEPQQVPVDVIVVLHFDELPTDN
jgi:uncharacterized protein (TIGR03435 family)